MLRRQCNSSQKLYNKKRVLVIAYYFPPFGGAGVQRTLKYVKYLREFGWEPLVLTINKGIIYIKDESLWGDVPEGIEIYRAYSAENWIIYLCGALRLMRLRSIASLIEKLWLIPDRPILWLPFAYMKALKVLRRNKFDLIYSTAYPYTSHLIGYLLKKKTGKPWVADFRDEWTQNPFLKYPTKFHTDINKRFEKATLESADMIISVSEPIIQGFKRLVKRDDKHFHVLTNGYDGDDFQPDQINSSNINHQFTICYTGSFYGLHSPNNFIEALFDLIKEKKIDASELKFRHIGRRFEFNHQSENNHFNIIESTGYVDHKTAIQYMQKSDVLLLFISLERGTGTYTGKIFEYIATGRPILAIVPKDGVAADLISRTRTGIVVEPENIQQIKDAIFRLYSQWKVGAISLNPDWKEINKYDRCILTRQLSGFFDVIINKTMVSV